MKCEELLVYLSDYIDRDLKEELAEEARAHLATCHNCHVVLDSTEQMIVLVRESGPQQIPAARRTALFGRLQQAFLENTPHPPESRT